MYVTSNLASEKAKPFARMGRKANGSLTFFFDHLQTDSRAAGATRYQEEKT